MTHYYICAYCGTRWTEAEAATLPQSNTTDVKPMCCGNPIAQETWEDEEISTVISDAVKEVMEDE